MSVKIAMILMYLKTHHSPNMPRFSATLSHCKYYEGCAKNRF